MGGAGRSVLLSKKEGLQVVRHSQLAVSLKVVEATGDK